MNIIERLTAATRKRIEYNRTLHELERLPAATAADLGIEGRDLRKVARKAVYGF